jgi:hypothetical protein
MVSTDNNTNSSVDLPVRIGEYIFRQMHLDNFIVLEYSKEAVMMRHIVPDSISEERIRNNLLVDVKESSLELAINEMKKKLDKISPNLKEQFIYEDSSD